MIDAIRGETVDPLLDDWLTHYFGDRLSELDRTCAGAGPEALAEFCDLDDDLWALLLSRNYESYPNIRTLLPELPPPDLQELWTGASGLTLLNQGKSFYGKTKARFEHHCDGDLEHSVVLDFGCGWGRLLRFFARDVAPGNLYGCDPNEGILELCRWTRVPATLARSDSIPEELPYPDGTFDLVYSFSVFTHLSETSHERSLQAIHRALKPGGLFVATIRPPAYLDSSELMQPLADSLKPDRDLALAEPRYMFVPHPPGGMGSAGTEISYGESVITLAYVRERWAHLFGLLDVSLQTADPYQVILTLRPR